MTVVLARWPLNWLTLHHKRRCSPPSPRVCSQPMSRRCPPPFSTRRCRPAWSSRLENARSHTRTRARARTHRHTHARAYAPATSPLLTDPRCVPGLAAVAARGARGARTCGAAAGGNRPIRCCCSGRARAPSPKIVRLQSSRSPLCHLVMAARCSSSARGRALASGDGASYLYLYFGKGFAWAMELANEVREALDKRDIRA